jgi:hypothetical protein
MRSRARGTRQSRVSRFAPQKKRRRKSSFKKQTPKTRSPRWTERPEDGLFRFSGPFASRLEKRQKFEKAPTRETGRPPAPAPPNSDGARRERDDCAASERQAKKKKKGERPSLACWRPWRSCARATGRHGTSRARQTSRQSGLPSFWSCSPSWDSGSSKAARLRRNRRPSSSLCPS